MDTIMIGNVEITALLDTPLLLDPKTFFPEHAAKLEAGYPELLDHRGLLSLSTTCYLVRSGGKMVLVDTGFGPRRKAGMPNGKLNLRLADAGIAPEDIDVVLHTHLHVDHVGWNVAAGEDGVRRVFFTRARHVIQQAEWDHWMRPQFLDDPEEDHLAACVQPLEREGRIDLVTGGEPFDANLTFLSTPGHTPGHVAVGVYSAGERAIIIGDASHTSVQLEHPDWSPDADTDGLLAASTRERLFDEAADDGRTFIAGHWQYPGFGGIVRLDGKRTFKAR